MADIDRRVRALIDVLIDRGFGWLAVEIVEAIEAGGDLFDNLDQHVAEQRRELDERISSGDASAKSTPQELKLSATRSESFGERVSGESQVAFAVGLLVDRLSSAAEMTSEGADELVKLMGKSVRFAVEVDGELRSITPQEARVAAWQLREIQHQLIEWLTTMSPGEET